LPLGSESLTGKIVGKRSKQVLLTLQKLSLKQARWAELMADYNLNIGYHPRKMNVIAD